MSDDLQEKINGAMKKKAAHEERSMDKRDKVAWDDLVKRAKLLSSYEKTEDARFDFNRAEDALSKSTLEYLCTEIPEMNTIRTVWETELEELCAREPSLDVIRHFWDDKYFGKTHLPSKSTLERLMLIYDWNEYNQWEITDINAGKRPDSRYSTWKEILDTDWKEFLERKSSEGKIFVEPNLREKWKKDVYVYGRLSKSATYEAERKLDFKLDTEGFLGFLNYTVYATEEKKTAVSLPKETPPHNIVKYLLKKAGKYFEKK